MRNLGKILWKKNEIRFVLKNTSLENEVPMTWYIVSLKTGHDKLF